MKKIGINGFGRIGRYLTRLSLDSSEVEVAVVNDISDIKTLAHLLKYDSVHRQLKHEFILEKDRISFANGKEIKFVQYKDPSEIPWKVLGVETVIESTGLFLTTETASKHLAGGAKRVLISAPANSDEIPTVVLGVNDNILNGEGSIISNASCTTNNAAPMVRVLHDLCEIESAYITTIHSYTSDQRLHDAPHKDLRRARAAAESIIPTSTGAAKAITKIFPDLDGKMGGCGVRVPVPDGSFTDLTVVAKNPPTVEQINSAMKLASETYLKGIMAYCEEPIVSVDIIGNSHSCVFDSELTSVVNNMIKVVGWYDNEAGYSNRLLELAVRI
jgi:glyceraldehyde 3-phosphate dehydrogenase